METRRTSRTFAVNIEGSDQLNESTDYPDRKQIKKMIFELNTIKEVESKEIEKVESIKNVESMNQVQTCVESINRDGDKIEKVESSSLYEIGDCYVYSLIQIFKIVFKIIFLKNCVTSKTINYVLSTLITWKNSSFLSVLYFHLVIHLSFHLICLANCMSMLDDRTICRVQ